jgi:hypothetical protein
MERTEDEEKAIKQIVDRLLKSVKEQEEKLGYIYWRHN